MRKPISRRVAYVALVVYSGLLAVLYRRQEIAFDVGTIALCLAVGLCLIAIFTFIAQNGPPK
jgi:hypothetical protein